MQPKQYDSQPLNEAKSNAVPCQHRAIFVCQKALFHYGLFIEQRWKLVLFMTVIVLGLCTFGIKGMHFESKASRVWYSDDGLRAESQDAEEMQESETLNLMRTQSLMQLLPDSTVTRARLLSHLRLLERAVHMKVRLPELHSRSFRLEQICMKQEIEHVAGLPRSLRPILRRLMPCRIVTPLDCFWEGARLLGPEAPVRFPAFRRLPESLTKSFTWSNLDPITVMRQYLAIVSPSNSGVSGVFESLKELGVGHAYMRKPCLDPSDEGCPTVDAVVNVSSVSSSRVLLALSEGCTGILDSNRQPLEDLVGGRRIDSRTGRLLGAKALHSSVLLKSPRHLLAEYRTNQPLADWTLEKVTRIVEQWQRQFRQLVDEENASLNSPAFLAFNEQSTDSALHSTTAVTHPTWWTAAVGASVLCALANQFDSKSLLHSHLTVGILILPLLLLSSVAGVGLCCWWRVPADMLAVQLLPFVQFGLGGFCCLLLTSHYNYLYQTDRERRRPVVPSLLQQEAPLLLSFLLACCGASGSVLLSPLPALRLLGVRCFVSLLPLTLLCMAGCPAALAADSARRRRLCADVVCCRVSRQQSDSQSLPKHLGNRVARGPLTRCQSSQACRIACLTLLLVGAAVGGCCLWRLLAGAEFDPLDAMPAKSMEREFLARHRRLFAKSSLTLRLKQLDYPRMQGLIRRFFHSLRRQPFVESDASKFWLDSFRDWLLDIQRKFVGDRDAGRFWRVDNFTFECNGSSPTQTLLAARLLTQSGRRHNYSMLRSGRLVLAGGQIDPKKFYSSLTSWYSQSGASYETANALLLPRPETRQFGAAELKLEVTVPTSGSLSVAQSHLILSNVSDTSDYLAARASVVRVSQRFLSLGVEHTISGTAIDFYSPDWLDVWRMAGCLSLLLLVSFLAGLLVFLRTLPALICTCLCLFNCLQLSAALLAANVQFNFLTFTGLALIFPFMHLVNLTITFHTCLRQESSAGNNNNNSSNNNNNNSSSSGSNIYVAIALEPEAPSPGWTVPSSHACVFVLQATPMLLAALAVAFVPDVPLLTGCVGLALVGGASCCCIVGCSLVAPALRLLPLRPHPVRRWRYRKVRFGPKTPLDSGVAAVELATSPSSADFLQRSLDTIPEETDGESSPATLTAKLPCQQQHQIVTATLQLRLQPHTCQAASV